MYQHPQTVICAIFGASLSMLSLGCADSEPVDTGPELAKTAKWQRPTALIFVDVETGAGLSGQVRAMHRSAHTLQVQLVGANPQDYTFGFSSPTLSDLKAQGDRLAIANEVLGSHTIKVVARNTAICRKYFTNRASCSLPSDYAGSPDPAIDISGSIVIQVIDTLSTDQEGVNEGGGILGWIVRNGSVFNGIGSLLGN